MKSLGLEQFVQLWKNSLLVLDFESDLREAQSSMNHRFEHSISKNRMLTTADKTAIAKSIGVKEAKVTDRNIYIFANVLFGLSYSIAAKEFEISLSRVKQIVDSELARFKHPVFQKVISSQKVIDKYKSVVSTQLHHLPKNELAQQMMLIMNQAKQLEDDIVDLRKSYIQNIVKD